LLFPTATFALNLKVFYNFMISHKLSVAPMLDWTDSSVFIGV
jgi:hypothetical protein